MFHGEINLWPCSIADCHELAEDFISREHRVWHPQEGCSFCMSLVKQETKLEQEGVTAWQSLEPGVGDLAISNQEKWQTIETHMDSKWFKGFNLVIQWEKTYIKMRKRHGFPSGK